VDPVSRYQRAVELEDLLVTLAESRQGLTIEEMCERYDVSRRTAERMRDALAERFPLVEADRHRGERRKRWKIELNGRVVHAVRPFGACERDVLARAATALREAGHHELASDLERLGHDRRSCAGKR
jgi:predicted DNA-binding transcriptional regulator YafY